MTAFKLACLIATILVMVVTIQLLVLDRDVSAAESSTINGSEIKTNFLETNKKCDTDAINQVPATYFLHGKPNKTKPWPSTTFARARRQSGKLLKVPKWNKTDLTYRISIFPTKRNGNGLDQKIVMKEFELAFGYWEEVSNLRFQKVTDRETKTDITIKFFRGEHGDKFPFDGPGKTLAHTFYPMRGEIHFDDEDKWSIGYRWRHYNLRTVGVHEIGHVIGLPHSSHPKSVMYSKYEGYRKVDIENFKLHHVDVAAVQAAYGSAKASAKLSRNRRKRRSLSPNSAKNVVEETRAELE